MKRIGNDGHYMLPRLGFLPTDHEAALCAQADPDSFFPEEGAQFAAPARTCNACTIRVECLEWAIENEEPYGMWGGKSHRQRKIIARRRELGLNDDGTRPDGEDVA